MKTIEHLEKIDRVYQNFLLYQKMRRTYKNPRKGLGLGFKTKSKNDIVYDVGGAFLTFLGKEYDKPERFPVPPQILEGLKELNPNLPNEKGRVYSEKIVNLNDNGHFEEAWENLKEALTYWE